MIYYTISYLGNKRVLDSYSNNYFKLKSKFPCEKIYKTDKPLTSIYINDI